MFSEESDHLECLRLKPVIYPNNDLATQPRLHVAKLLQLLRERAQTDGVVSKGKSTSQVTAGSKGDIKKRPRDPESDGGARKKVKVSLDDAVSISGSEDERLFHAYRRVFRLRFTTTSNDPRQCVDEERLKDLGWLEDEAAVLELLMLDAPNHTIVDLGVVPIRIHNSNSAQVWVNAGDGSFLLAFPAGRSPFVPDDYDFNQRAAGTNLLQDPLQAFQVLAAAGRAQIEAHLFLDLTTADTPDVLPFTLRLQVDCSFVCPNIFAPVDSSTKAGAARALEVQEAQRRLTIHLFPPQSSLPASYHGQTDIPFLFSILRPAPALPSPKAYDTLQPESLRPTLLPFQRRSVGWMLTREGKAITSSGDVVAQTDIDEDQRPLPLFWEQVRISPEKTWFVNRLRGLISSTRPTDEDELNEEALGGIVAEEPGLGKTLECISTIIMNPAIDRSPENKHWDAETKLNIKEIKATLIVTPPSLAPQWADELAAHAPHLKVLIYEGWQKVPVPISERDVLIEKHKREAVAQAKKAKAAKGKRRAKATDVDAMDIDEDDDEIVDWCAYVNSFDVCITTYTTLQHDLGVARPPPTRPRRAFVQYSTANRPRSPLVMCQWYRVIMDEVQMVGGGKTEEMVSLIPRLSSFAVSGTPARHQVSDLIHVLKFLRVNAVVDVPRAWTRLQLPGYVREFTELFRRYTVRTMKETVKDELTIPPQTRFLVPVELGRVQRHVYDQTLESALLDLGLDVRGVAATENWEADVAKLRHWLRRLRELCTHPQIGQLLAKGHDKLHQPGVLKSMSEVLEAMREQNWRSYMEDRNEKVENMTLQAQLVQQDDKNRNRYREAIDVLLAAEKEGDKLIADVLETAKAHAKEGERLRAEVRAARRHGSTGAQSTGTANDGKGKGKETRKETSASPDIDFAADEDDLPRNAIGEAYKGKLIAINSRLREARISLHKVKFLQGDVYHVLGATYEAEENAAYASAEELRRVLLKSTEEAAEKAMIYLAHDPVVKQLKEKDLFVKEPYLGKGGIRSAALMEEANELIGGLLNAQSTLLWQWREKLIVLLTQPLVGTDNDGADGQEYNRSLETQGEAEAYLQAYAALLADRRETLTAERTLLAAHDEREVKARKTKAARKAQILATSFETLEQEELQKLDEGEVLPEHELLLKDLNNERKALLEEYNPERAVKSIMVDLNNVVLRCKKGADPEKEIAQDAVAKLRSLILEQGKLIDRLHSDLGHLRKAFNERIAYFRQLQEISDTVAEAEWGGTLADGIEANKNLLASLERKINTARARQRYMDNLSKSHEEGTMDEDDKTCILCKCDFIRGYITQCAHVYCEDCMKAWVSRSEGKSCPVCRVPINASQLQRFSIDNNKPGEQHAQPPPKILEGNEIMPRSRREIQYSYIDAQTLQDIQAIDLLGSYGSKIETLVKHLLYLNITDPGAKSIVFSAWADSLLIIQHALKANGITCLRIDQNHGKQNAAKKFRTDPTISVLLLHGERENAGLNVTCASRVFMVESVVHHAFEVQAIARIDRMGQTRPTEVYCYYAEETVERNILDLAAKQGLSLYTRDNAAGTLNVTPFAADSDKKQVDAPAKKVLKGDFVFKTDDMLAIFFPHMFEDVEYLLPSGELSEDSQAATRGATLAEPPQRRLRSTQQDNAIAGPSRLR